MARALTPEFLAALTSPHSIRGYAAELAFASGTVRINTTPYNLTLFGQEYGGVGQFGGLMGLEESSAIQSSAQTLVLTNIPNDMASIALNEHYYGRSAVVLFFLLTPDLAVIPDPIILCRGRMDQMTIEVGNATSVTLSVENAFVNWERAKVRYLTVEDQRRRYPGLPDDNIAKFASQTSEKQITWPAASWWR